MLDRQRDMYIRAWPRLQVHLLISEGDMLIFAMRCGSASAIFPSLRTDVTQIFGDSLLSCNLKSD